RGGRPTRLGSFAHSSWRFIECGRVGGELLNRPEIRASLPMALQSDDTEGHGTPRPAMRSTGVFGDFAKLQGTAAIHKLALTAFPCVAGISMAPSPVFLLLFEILFRKFAIFFAGQDERAEMRT